MYAEFMRKYTNNPRIRTFRNNDESLQFLTALEGNTIAEKFYNAGIPMPGFFDPHEAKVMNEGDWAYWVTLAPCQDGFDVRISFRNMGQSGTS